MFDCRGAWARWGVVIAALVAAPARGERPIRFNHDIRPILSEYCYSCHGPDNAAREAGLRLDQEEPAKADLESGRRAIVPGNPTDSELIARVLATDPDQRMPPADSGKSLSQEQIERLRGWIAGGAEWERHWSLTPIARPPVPAAADPIFSRNPIDAFVLETLARHGLEHAPPADGATLVRRLHLDLIGLPPSPEDVDRFVAGGASAYEKLVDSLLASPHFGERMAVFWLDLVRYADSVGYHGDQAISVSPFRDYVIASFNANKPFDQFTIEQIAGDLLDGVGREQRIASGYNRLGMMSAEGGVQDREYRAKYAAERVRNLGGVWLGMTLGCCECHDHKYDPFTTREFYSLEAFFADIKEKGFYDAGFLRNDWGPAILVPSEAEQKELDQLEAAIAEVRALLDRATPELEAAQRAWEQSVQGSRNWTPIKPLTAVAKSGVPLLVQADGSIRAGGEAAARDLYTVTFRAEIKGITALRLEALPDDSLPNKGPGRAANGNFVLTGIALAYQRAPQGTTQPIVLDNASATFEQAVDANAAKFPGLTAASVLAPGKDKPWGWAISPETGRAQHAVFETILDLHPEPTAILSVALEQGFDNPGHLLGRFRLSVTNDPRPVKATGAEVPAEIRELLALSADARSPEARARIAAHYRSIAPLLAPERARLEQVQKKKETLVKSITTAQVTESVEPRVIRVLARGNWMDESGPIVEPALPAVLPQPPFREGRLGRLDLARWLVARDNPLTPRVLVNRLWKLYFGAGLSRKLDDLGAQGEWPSHPELLDWLASELVDSGWDVKRLIKLIVLSGTYRQGSSVPRAVVARDPENRWLARQGRFRLDAEFVRDSALATSGLLVRTIGGRSVKPYQPPGYWSFLNFPIREWENGKGADLYRRGLYTHWQRQYLHPALLAFDAPSREECTAERVRSSTPLQSLVLLNDAEFVEAARVFAERAVVEGGASDPDRLDWIFRQALARPIKPAERAVLAGLLAKHRDEGARDPSAAAILAVGEKPAGSSAAPAELAAWTSVTRAVLNLHAFVTRY